MSLKGKLTHGTLKRPVKKAAKKPAKKAVKKRAAKKPPRKIEAIPARMEFEVDGEAVDVRVYRTDRSCPNSLAYTFRVTREELEKNKRCMILYDAILAPLAEALGLC